MPKLLFDRVHRYFAGLNDDDDPYISSIKKEWNNTTVFLNEDALMRAINGEIVLDDLPSFAPPYPSVFVECKAPNREREVTLEDGKREVIFQYGTKIGVLFTALDRERNELEGIDWIQGCEPLMPELVRWQLSTKLFIEGRGARDFFFFGAAEVFLDNQGRPLAFMKDGKIGYSYVQLEQPFVDELYKNLREEDQAPIFDHWYSYAELSLNAAMFTIGMTHCRNIGTEVFSPSAAENKKFTRQNGIPMTRYHVLKITGKGRSAGTLIGNITGQQMPLHWVRGHFKTFGDEAPLMGKHVGTFYFHEHIRGSIKRGVVTKDYEVKP